MNPYPNVVEAYALNEKLPHTVQAAPFKAFDASAPPVFTALTPDEIGTREFLNSNYWPIGFQNNLIANTKRMPYRFIICDDSGSMAENDGKRVVGKGSNTKEVKCTRWMEMTESLKFHASLAQALNLPTEFRMLNSAAPLTIGGQFHPNFHSI
jgi:hypothetical protein